MKYKKKEFHPHSSSPFHPPSPSPSPSSSSNSFNTQKKIKKKIINLIPNTNENNSIQVPIHENFIDEDFERLLSTYNNNQCYIFNSKTKHFQYLTNCTKTRHTEKNICNRFTRSKNEIMPYHSYVLNSDDEKWLADLCNEKGIFLSFDQFESFIDIIEETIFYSKKRVDLNDLFFSCLKRLGYDSAFIFVILPYVYSYYKEKTKKKKFLLQAYESQKKVSDDEEESCFNSLNIHNFPQYNMVQYWNNKNYKQYEVSLVHSISFDEVDELGRLPSKDLDDLDFLFSEEGRIETESDELPDQMLLILKTFLKENPFKIVTY